MYCQLATLNEQLRGTNTDLLRQLQAQVEELARSRGMITQAEERLRRELAEVLHSRVQNRLLMVWYRLEECQDLLERDPTAAGRLIAEVREQLDEIRVPRLELPALPDGVDLGSLYELAEALSRQGVS